MAVKELVYRRESTAATKSYIIRLLTRVTYDLPLYVHQRKNKHVRAVKSSSACTGKYKRSAGWIYYMLIRLSEIGYELRDIVEGIIAQYQTNPRTEIMTAEKVRT